MSAREDEDRHKNCPNRGAGLEVAVAAIGARVGAALHYFMNRWQENPNTTGSTTQDWTSEPEHNFHKRSWTLEECSICFEVVLQDQELMSLPCTHHFHTKCILPWLQEHRTCPNCRKSIDRYENLGVDLQQALQLWLDQNIPSFIEDFG